MNNNTVDSMAASMMNKNQLDHLNPSKSPLLGEIVPTTDNFSRRAAAQPIYGIRRLIPVPSNNFKNLDLGASSSSSQQQQQQPVEVVYSRMHDSPKGIALLLHACTHNALKFFSPSPSTCRQCVGLAEELRIVRLVQERGYVPVAVTCVDSESGCWSDRDLPRLQQVLRTFQEELRPSNTTTKNSTTILLPPRAEMRLPVIAIGASSGGHMAAKVAAEGLADAALVMVMGLKPALQEQLVKQQPPLYLAPMPRDQRTLKRNRENYQALVAANYNAAGDDHESTTIKKNDLSVTTSSSSSSILSDRVILDEKSCVPCPVTVDYLVERVPGITRDHAARIILALQNSGHLGSEDQLFRKDPTVSDWRNALLALNPTPDSQLQSQNQQEGARGHPTDEILWGKFPLTRGQSPLAKAFHRAWAFHEYCSESVPLALDFFERFLL